MKNFELPYNFDPEWFRCLEIVKDRWDKIDCVYLPCFTDDGESHNTRENILRHKPKDWNDYVEHVQQIQSYGLNIKALCQWNATIDIIEKHMSIGINMFTLNDDELAKHLKDKFGNKIKLTLSCTRKITPEELNTLDLSMYDIICLPFWYNRHLSVVNNLPDKYKYSIIVNTTCLWNCPWCEKHWKGDNSVSKNCIKIRGGLFKPCDMNVIANIRPEDIDLFEVETFKLEGREFPSNIIFMNFDFYSQRKSFRQISGFNEEDIRSNYDK